MSTTPSPAAADPVVRSAGNWVLDPSTSSVDLAHSTMWGLVRVKGRFSGLSGRGQVDPDGSVFGTVSIDAASIDTGNTKRDKHLRSDDFFKAEDHPQITFEAGSAKADGTGFTVDGVLTAGGADHALQVPVAVRDQSDDAITLEANVEVDPTRHGMTFNRLGMIRGNTRVRVVARFVRSGNDAQ